MKIFKILFVDCRTLEFLLFLYYLRNHHSTLFDPLSFSYFWFLFILFFFDIPWWSGSSPNQIWLKNSKKKIVPAQEKKILKMNKNIYSRMKSKLKVWKEIYESGQMMFLYVRQSTYFFLDFSILT
jgi:hypothetical protein